MTQNLLLWSAAALLGSHALATLATAASVPLKAKLEPQPLQTFPCHPLTHEPEEIRYHVHQTPEESILTICVQVSEASTSLEGIDSFVWSKEEPEGIPNPFMISVENGYGNPQSTSLQDCPAGSKLCSFQTQLGSDFYESEGVISGQGLVRLHTDHRDPQRRNLAGTATVGVTAYVKPDENGRPPLKSAATASKNGGLLGGSALSLLLSTLALIGLWMAL